MDKDFIIEKMKNVKYSLTNPKFIKITAVVTIVLLFATILYSFMIPFIILAIFILARLISLYLKKKNMFTFKYNAIYSVVLVLYFSLLGGIRNYDFLFHSLSIIGLVLVFVVFIYILENIFKFFVNIVIPYFKNILGISEFFVEVARYSFMATLLFPIPALFSHGNDTIMTIWAYLFISSIVFGILTIIWPKTEKQKEKEKSDNETIKRLEKERKEKDKKEKEICKRIELFYTDNLNKKYQIIKSISIKDKKGFNNARKRAKLIVDNLGGDAIIAVKESTTSETTGDIYGEITNRRSVVAPDKIKGSTSTKITYYITGTVVKYISEEESKVLEWDEDKYYEDLLKFQNLYEKNLITKNEFDKKISELKKIKESIKD